MKQFHSLWMFVVTMLVCSVLPKAQQVTSRIHLNQEGFYPQAPKLAAIEGDVPSAAFFIMSTNLADTFYRGTLKEARTSAYSPITIRLADFSSLQQTGSFVLLVPGLGHSYPFQVDHKVHSEAAAASLKGFYFQRMSMPLEKQYASKWHRSAGHADNQVYIHPSAASKERPAGTALSSMGGWYDAGDYNKYIVNSGITMGTLLSAYEDFPSYFNALTVNIPESRNTIPDILDEVLYNLRWMLTMQDPNDGGVYHKCTNANFDGMVMPGITKEPRYLVQKSTAASLDFAAVMAQASRVYRRFGKALPGLADSCSKAALAAWSWAQKNPSLVYSQKEINSKFKPAITTGEYGDRNLSDEWLWAASELFATTKERAFFDTVAFHLKRPTILPSWASVGQLGYYTFLRLRNQLPLYTKPIVQAMQDSVLAMADQFLAGMQRNAFYVVIGQTARDFVWGSNSVACNQGIVLINAFQLTKNKKYVDAALQNVDYILGRNATGYSFLTGIGSKPAMHPHHRQSEADGVTEPVPGLLAGGPNPGRQDSCAYTFTDPERAYTDIACSYASNEIAINWNAPAVYLLHSIEALQYQLAYANAKGSRKSISHTNKRSQIAIAATFH
jgi:endoglucanase